MYSLNLLLRSIEVLLGCNVRGNHLGCTTLLLLLPGGFGNASLFLIVKQNQGGVLTLDGRRQAILMIVPEKIEQFLETDHRGIIVNFQHLSMVTPA